MTAVRAVRVHEFGGPDVLVLDEVPQPVPVEGEVLVRIQAAGVNPFETYARAGSYSNLPALPYTPGCDGAGVRVDTGERVYVTDSLSGTYAEYALCPAEAVRPLPDDLSYAQGAAVGVPYFTAYRALLQRAAAKDGERVLVHGASGGVGIATVQLAVAAGLEVTGTAGSEAGRELVAAQGVAQVLDHGDPAHVDAALALTGGAGFDVIIEFLANVNLGSDLKLLAKRGRVVVVGSRGTVEVDARDLMNAEGAVLGMLTPNARRDEVAAALGAVDAGLRSGVLKPVVGREVPLAEAARAHRLIMERPALGKMVLVP
ncbi:MAG TPA: NADPH:quinone reductase [Thermoleophilia bacterium]|nr:NADPH:quinone reductase [Thermoleophilia bacterium]